MNLVIVESPAKAKTINKYLGDNYTVLASYGHIRDLPSKNGSVDPEQNFKMEWEVDSFSKKYLNEITDAAKSSSKIILSESLTASVISFKYFFEKESISHNILNLFSGSTDPFFEGRSLICP